MKFLFIAGYISADIVRALCWTLLHSLWQGLIAAAIAGVIILTTRHSKAVLRYNLLSIVFISFIVCTFFTFLYQPGIIDSSFNSATKINVSIMPAENFVVTDVAKNWIPTIQKKTFFQPIIYYGNKYSSLIAGIWAIFFFFHVLRMLSGLRQAYQLRYLRTFSPAQEWKERLYTLSSLVGIHSKVLLKESGIIKTPVLIGFLKPVILVPLGMFANLSVEQVETIFVHELAHIRRRDFAVNLLQRFAESFFFFNPFISWVSSLVREEREACCDDIVLEYTRDKKSYLEALVSFREADIETPQYALALGGSNSLLNRAKRILTNENKKLNVMEKVTLILVVLGITAFSFIPEKKNKTVLHPKATVINPADQLKAVKEDRFGTIQSSATVSPNDTVPSRVITFTNLSIYNNEDEKGNTREVKALGSDGKKYRYKLLNDEITEFEINGVSVGKENFKKYSFVLDRINENEKENRVLLLKKMGLESGTLQSKQLLMKEQQAGIDDLIAKTDAKTNLPPSDQLLLLKAQQEELQNKIQLLEADQNLQTELQANNNLQLLKARQFDLQNKKIPDDKLSLLKTNDKLQLLKSQQFDIQNKNQLLLDDKLNLQNEVLANNKLELLKDDQLSFEKQSALNNNLALQRLQSIQSVLPNDEIEDIIDILSDAGVVKDKHDLSFTLNFNELIVNGKKQEKSLYNMLKEKYIKGKKDHYIYKTNGHSTSTDISKE